MEKSKLTRPKVARQVTSKVKSMFIIFCDIKGIGHKEFVLEGRTVSSALLMWRYGDCVKTCKDFTPNFGDKRTGITTTCCLSLLFSLGSFWPKTTWVLWLMSVSLIEDKPGRLLFWHRWGDRGRIAGDAEHPHRTQLPGCILRMVEVIGTVHMRTRGLLQGWWLPVGRKLIFDQMVPPVPEIMDEA
jgi:hypothetical protein